MSVRGLLQTMGLVLALMATPITTVQINKREYFQSKYIGFNKMGMDCQVHSANLSQGDPQCHWDHLSLVLAEDDNVAHLHTGS